jgi:hypothetical protein
MYWPVSVGEVPTVLALSIVIKKSNFIHSAKTPTGILKKVVKAPNTMQHEDDRKHEDKTSARV